MKNRAAIVSTALALLISPAFVSAGIFFEKEPFTSWGFSPGYKTGDKLYFIANYALRRRAKGIAAFPDGGIPKTNFAKTYFCSFDTVENKLDILAHLGDERLPGGISGGVVYPTVKFNLKKGVFYAAYRIKKHSNTGPDTYGMFSWDMEKRRLVKIQTELQESFFEEHFGHGEAEPEMLAHYKMYRLVKEIPLEEWGLPTVLDYCKKSDSAYAKDLILLRGDYSYRLLVIDKLGRELSADGIRDILAKMEKRKNKLRSYEKMRYDMLSKETREALEGLLKNK
ncbi:MAG: hypothetical protein CVU78_00320 [Elusimicrobia bacterium HGW-Elusimicrobia-2]|nr:MAG: hypothetical protein CVU78_00320 [Elusimicrobia bacterium HGW-Elusimicrobia-2]